MLLDIKSSFFIRKLFALLYEKVKLKLARYNKKLQNDIEISITNYMLFSDKYIIFEGKDKGKEYDSTYAFLTFEGKYLNGERNGKGKEYHNNGKLKFEGEYLNGKKNGKGKEYNRYGKLEFEGEYLNGKRNGKGRESHSYYYAQLIFEGEYLNGKKWNGKGYLNNKVEYELNEGKGYIKEYYTDNKKDNKIIKFEGEYLNGERNGKGKEYDDKGYLMFEGEYLNGERNGKGKELFKYEGEYLNGKRHGKGKQTIFGDDKNYIVEGEFLYNKLWTGKWYDPENNNNVICELVNGKGTFREYGCFGHLRYEGEYLKGKRNGKGKEYKEFNRYQFNNELIFEGEFVNGQKYNGKGKFKIDQELFEIEYLKGKLWNVTIKELINDENNENSDKDDIICCEVKEGKGYIKLYHDIVI